MSKPLLATSPTVRLQVGADRQLRADALLSQAPTNGLRSRPDGLWQQPGRRRFAWNVTGSGSVPLLANVNQELIWTRSVFATDDAFAIGAPTRVVFSEPGRYFSECSIEVTFPMNPDDVTGQLICLRNGSELVAVGQSTVGKENSIFPTLIMVRQTTYVDIEVGGDYIEQFWRFLPTTGAALLAGSTWSGMWGGGAITP